MNTNANTHGAGAQKGGIILGVVVGALVGLGVALAVAMYIMKVPAPFSSKNAPRSAEQDKMEAKKNKDWDPNAALSGVKPIDPASAPTAPTTNTSVEVQRPNTNAPANQTPAPSKSSEEFVVQLGAYGNKEEAAGQRAKLTLAGFDVHIEEREQSGKMVYRIRTLGADRAGADQLRDRAKAAGFDALVVKVQK